MRHQVCEAQKVSYNGTSATMGRPSRSDSSRHRLIYKRQRYASQLFTMVRSCVMQYFFSLESTRVQKMRHRNVIECQLSVRGSRAKSFVEAAKRARPSVTDTPRRSILLTRSSKRRSWKFLRARTLTRTFGREK
jgi:hypothetical protein